ncbi:MAG: radical SAM protein [Nitrospirae bacterium]|nr:radical SAM protein [Nitrospirota bacterium]
MIKEEYSPYKIVHHMEKLQELAAGKQTDPVQVHLIPSNRCNQNCSFCAYRMAESSSSQNFNPKDIMSNEKLLEIIDSCYSLGVKAIQYTGGGEPLVHPAIKNAFKKTISYGMDLALVSNGQALDDELIELLSDVAWVRISMDAANSGTYSILRRTKATVFDRVIASISKFAQKKCRTILGIGFVISRENYRETYDACKLFKELGVDNFRISAAFTPLGIKYFDGLIDEAKTIAEKAKRDFEDEKFTVFNLFNDRIGDLFDGVQNYDFCPMKELVPYIGADLKVYTCCMLAYNNLGYIGSLKNQSFDELWHGGEKIQFYRKHSPRVYCKLPCMFEKKNDFINYCIKKDAKHTNFI